MMASDGVSLRETRLGVIAHFLDKLPPRFSDPIFIFLWAAMLLGWIVPAALGLRRLLRSSRPKRVSDLRPLRALLHDIPSEQRSKTQRNRAYWADSYDALICYKTVAPLQPCRLEPIKPSHDRSRAWRAFVSLTGLHLALYSCTVAAFATSAASMCPVAQNGRFCRMTAKRSLVL
jgi:hypothetical protein